MLSYYKQHKCPNVPIAVQNTFGTHSVTFILVVLSPQHLQIIVYSTMFSAAGTGKNMQAPWLANGVDVLAW